MSSDSKPHSELPNRVVVGANGAYWRDFGDSYSMCPVSTDNDPVEVTASYVRAEDDFAPEYARLWHESQERVRSLEEQLEAEHVDRSEWREGMVSVYDYEGNCVGSMGQETWTWMLDGGKEQSEVYHSALELIRDKRNEDGSLITGREAEAIAFAALPTDGAGLADPSDLSRASVAGVTPSVSTPASELKEE